jgi:SAM-dependent methyltransferase
MLAHHLDQGHDRASRSQPIIQAQVEFLNEQVLRGPSRVLDLCCGPGLYCAELAQRGHRCVGIDFGPASIEHARSLDAASDYRHEDVRTAELGEGFDLVLFSFGEFNAFAPAEARALLSKSRAAVRPGGAIVLEVHTERFIHESGRRAATWRALPKSVFSDSPHLWLEEHFWLPEDRVAIDRSFIVDGEGDVQVFHNTLQAYSDDEYRALLEGAGFPAITQHSSLGRDADLFFLVGRG